MAVIATFAALASALGTMLTVLRLRKAEEASFFMEMTDRYNQPEMQEALRELASWYKTNPTDFTEKWIRDLAGGAPEARALDAHRRRVNRYFANVAQLYQSGYIDRRLASLISNFGGLNIYYKVVVPMGDTAYGVQGDRYPETLKRIRSQHGHGEIR